MAQFLKFPRVSSLSAHTFSGQTLSVLLTTALIFCSLPSLGDEISEQWQSSKLDFEDTDLYFNNTKCFEINPSFSTSCLNGILKATRLSNLHVVMVESEVVGKNADRYRLLLSLGPVALVEDLTPNPVATLKEKIQARAAELEQLKKYGELIFKQPSFSFATQMRALKNYVSPEMPVAQIVGTAITGQLEISDGHAQVAPAKLFESKEVESIVGIGILLQLSSEGFRVGQVINNSPALESGLKAGDIIRKIDDETLSFEMTDSDVVSRLRGVENVPVDITISRPGVAQEKTIRIVRRRFESHNVLFSSLKNGEQTVGVIQLLSFIDDMACDKIKKHIVERPEYSAWVLDLRNNGGGQVHQAVCISGLFVGPDKVVFQYGAGNAVGKTPVALRPEKTQENQITAKPLLILQNYASASASEIVAAALQDHERAWILGELSFGKGTVQDVSSFELDPFETVIVHTTQFFHRPSGQPNQGFGVVPDFKVATEALWEPRELDVFPTAWKIETKAWSSPRPAKIAALNNCLKAQSNSSIVEDPYLSKALTLLACP